EAHVVRSEVPEDEPEFRCSYDLPPRCDPLVGVVRSARAGTPEAELPGPRPLCEILPSVRVLAPAVPVEVGRGGTDSDEADIHVDAVADADDVTEQSPVAVHSVGYRLRKEANLRAGWEKQLCQILRVTLRRQDRRRRHGRQLRLR